MAEMNNQDSRPKKARIVKAFNMPTIYAEGLSQIMIGVPMSRLMLHSLVQRADDRETTEDVHQIACELVMPTPALIETAKAILTSLSESKAELQGVNMEWVQKANELLDSIPSPSEATSQK